MNNHVTVADHILRRCRNLKQPVALYGRLLCGSVSLWSLEPNAFLEPVGLLTPLALPLDRVSQVPVIVECGLGLPLRALVLGEDGARREATMDIVVVERHLQARHSGLLETRQLHNRKVSFVGCGSVAAKMVRQLVEAGVGRIALADGDVFAPQNVGRHCLGVDAIGLPKATAMADQLKLVNPELKTTCLTVPLGPETTNAYLRLLRGSSLVVIATDSVEINAMVQGLCVELGGVPAVVVGCWERAFAAEVIYSNPRAGTPCYCCIRDVLPGPARGPVDYSAAPTAAELPQPGLGADVAYVAAVAAKVALVHLTKDWKANLISRQRPVLLVSTRAEEFFAQACQVSQVEAKPKSDCWVCSPLRRA